MSDTEFSDDQGHDADADDLDTGADDADQDQDGDDSGEGEGDAQPDPKAAVEARASRLGWVPKDKFKGDPKRWRDASEFLAINDESAPVAKERLTKVERELADAKASMARMERMNAKALERQREQLEAKYRDDIRAASLEGDADRVEELIAERDEKLKPEADDDTPAGLPAEEMTAVQAWVAKNDWYAKDQSLNAEATLYEDRLAKTTRLSLSDRLAATQREMHRRYPDIVPAPVNGSGVRPATPTTAMGGGVRGGGTRRLADKLTAEEARQADRFIAQGLYKNREEYAKELES